MKSLLIEALEKYYLTEAKIEQVYKYYQDRLSPEEFNELVMTDPTYKRNKPQNTGKYIKWLTSMYDKNPSIMDNLPKDTLIASINQMKMTIYYYKHKLKNVND